MRQFIACALAVIFAAVAFGQTQADSVQVYFRLNRSSYDPTYYGNAASMNNFVDRVRVAAGAEDLDYVLIAGYASPDGPLEANMRLADKRCETLARLIVKLSGINRDKIRTRTGGVAWSELKRLVAETPDVPARDKVMEILTDKSLKPYYDGDKLVDERKNRLMELDNGVPYRWMLEHIFPKLRYAFGLYTYYKPQIQDSTAVLEPLVAEALPEAVIVDEAVAETESEDMAVEEVFPDEEAVATPVDTMPSSQTETTLAQIPPYHKFALKTNLLYYAALMPNIGLEYLVNDNWSVAADFNIAWYGNFDLNKSYRIAEGDLEVRRWFRQRAPWHGFFVGLFAGGGLYDLENGGTGYYGEGVLTGLSAGYMWPISRNLSFEAAVGAGYLYTRVKEYEPFEGHHVYQRTKALNYFGPLKLKFSLVWRFCDINKSKRNISGI